MNNVVTLMQLLNIDSTMCENSKQNEALNLLLTDVICNQYDIITIKRKLQNLFSKFKSARYLYDFPIEENIKISANYEIKEEAFQKTSVSQVEKAVDHYVDNRILTTDIYNSLIKVSYKLTNDEVTYLINTFLIHKSEDSIAEILQISKTYLQKIKKSCIVKMWVDLKQYCKDEN